MRMIGVLNGITQPAQLPSGVSTGMPKASGMCPAANLRGERVSTTATPWAICSRTACGERGGSAGKPPRIRAPS